MVFCPDYVAHSRDPIFGDFLTSLQKSDSSIENTDKSTSFASEANNYKCVSQLGDFCLSKPQIKKEG